MDETSEARCVGCGAPIESTSYSGVLCAACFEAEQNPAPRGWGVWMNRPSTIGLATVALGFAISISVNGVDYAKGLAGGLALIWGLTGLIAAGKQSGEIANKQRVGAAIVTLLGLFLIVRGLVLV